MPGCAFGASGRRRRKVCMRGGLARSRATQQTLFFALSFAAVGLRGTTGAAKADTAVFLVFTGARVEATTRVAEAETAKDIFGGVGCAVQ